jgi:hypothetical protein
MAARRKARIADSELLRGLILALSLALPLTRRLALLLPLRLAGRMGFHRNPHRQHLSRRTDADAGDWRGIAVVAPRRDPHIARIGTDAVGDIEADPAEPLDMGFGPSVGRLLFDPVVHHQIAADIARRNPVRPRGADEDVGVILTHPCPVADRLFGGGGRMRAAGFVSDPVPDQVGQCMQEIERRSAITLRPGLVPGRVSGVWRRKLHRGR